MAELVARVQLDLIKRLVADLESRPSSMREFSHLQAMQIAIIALLRSVGHVFRNVDCNDSAKESWAAEKWRAWSKAPVFRDFIEPERNALLKEFRGILTLQNSGVISVAISADPSAPGGGRIYADFDPSSATDVSGGLIILKVRRAIEFWDGCLTEAEMSSPFVG